FALRTQPEPEIFAQLQLLTEAQAPAHFAVVEVVALCLEQQVATRIAPEQPGIETERRTDRGGKVVIVLKTQGAHGKTEQPFAQLPLGSSAAVDTSHEALIPISPRHALGTGGDLPGPGLDQIGTRRQRADADQIEVLELPVIAFVLAQPELPQLDLGPEWKAVEVVEQIVIGQAQGVVGKGALTAMADTQLQGARPMAFLGQLRPWNLQARRRVAVDRLQQAIAAVGAGRIPLLTGLAIAQQSVGAILNQGAAFGRQSQILAVLQRRVISGQALYPTQLAAIQRGRARQQFMLAGGSIIDALDQPGVLHCPHGVCGDGGQRELIGELQPRPGNFQQLEQTVGAVFVEEEVIEADLAQLPDMLEHAPGFLRRQVQPVFPQVAVFHAAVFGDLLAIGHQREKSGVAAHQALPGIQNAVVHALDKGAEVERVTQQRAALVVDIRRVDAQQSVPEHR